MQNVFEEIDQSLEPYNMYSNVGCVNDVITLSCPTNRNISITKALWGQYFRTCSDCCPPNPAFDCTVDMETNEPALFSLLKDTCDGKETCDLEYIAYIVNDCQLEYVADYEQVFYDCLPVNVSGPVGFSVRVTKIRTLNDLELIPFDDVISNFGGHYSVENKWFTCPIYGIYSFSITMSMYDNNDNQVFLFRNTNELIRSWADSGVYYDSTSATVITECNPGDRMFVSTLNGGKLDGYSTPIHFTGYLLYVL